MTWWMRPGPSRFWAMRKPSPGSPTCSSPARAHPCSGSRSGPIAARVAHDRHGRMILKPGRVRRHDDLAHPPVRLRLGSVTAMTIANAAPLAPEVNHLWPLITHSSPSRTARRAQPGRVGAGDLRLGHREARADVAATSGPSQRSFCSAVPNLRISVLPVSGAGSRRRSGAYGLRPISSFTKAYGRKPVPVPPASGPMWGAHRPAALDLGPQLLEQRPGLVVLAVETAPRWGRRAGP